MSFEDYNLDALQLIRPAGQTFQMYVMPRFCWHYEKNEYEAYTARLISRMCERASIFVDIGAHYGFFSILAASKNPDLHVISAEPVSQNFFVINKNVELNSLKSVRTFNLAISDAEGRRMFQISEASDNCSFYAHPSSRVLRTESVEVTSVDTLLSEMKVGPIIVKIDTDGNEFAVLNGMRETLRRFKDIALFVEFNPKMIAAAGRTPDELIRLLDESGFSIFIIDDIKKCHFRLLPGMAWADYMEVTGYKNLLCLPKQRALSILFISHSSNLGGAERSLLELIDELIVDYWTLSTIICPGEGAITRALSNLGAAVLLGEYYWWCNVERRQASTEAAISASVRTIATSITTLRNINPDLIWTQSIVIPWGAVIARVLGKPHIWSICEYGEKDHQLVFNIPFAEVLQYIQQTSNYFFVNSRSMLGEMFPDVGVEKAGVLYRHVRVPDNRELMKGISVWRKERSTRIGMFATIEEGKGQEDLIRAVGIVVSRGLKVEVIVAGFAIENYLLQLRRLVVELGIADVVSFSDFIADPYPTMASADIIVNCSRHEAFGRSIVEAMLLRRAVVYPNRSGPAEYMIDGTTGLSYSPGNVAELADRIEALVCDRARREWLGGNAYVHARETFSRADYGGKVHAKLMQLCGEHQSNYSNTSFIDQLLATSLGELAALGRSKAADQELRRLVGELKERDQRLVATDQELRRLAGELKERDQRLVAADQDLRRVVGELKERDQRLVATDQELRRLAGELKERDQRLVAADQDLRRVVGELKERDQRLVATDQELRRLAGELKERDQRLVTADQDLRGLVGELKERNRRLVAADQDLRRLLGELKERDQRLLAADLELRRLIREAEEHAQRLVAVDQDLRRLLGELQERDRRLVVADQDLRRLIGEAEEQAQRLVAVDRDLRRLVGELKERDQRLVMADLDLRRLVEDVEERNQRLVVADQYMHRLESDLKERDQQLLAANEVLRRLTGEFEEREQRLAEADRRIASIETSTAWRMLCMVRTILGKLGLTRYR